MKELSNTACIVGVDESDEIGILPNTSQLSLHLQAITNAVKDAGLKVKDVDGIFTAGQHSPSLLGEALGVNPRYVDGTTVGGCSFIMMVGHAVAALHHGLCDVAVVSHGESGRSGVGVTPRRDTALPGQYELPYGFGGAPTYFGLITTRHMHEYGTTLEQWAQVAVSTRAWAGLNPKARNREPITVAERVAISVTIAQRVTLTEPVAFADANAITEHRRVVVDAAGRRRFERDGHRDRHRQRSSDRGRDGHVRRDWRRDLPRRRYLHHWCGRHVRGAGNEVDRGRGHRDRVDRCRRKHADQRCGGDHVP